MADDKIEVEGTILELCRGGQFRCSAEISGSPREIMAYTSGKMKKFAIRIVVGDHVRIELSPYDFTKGRITFRDK